MVAVVTNSGQPLMPTNERKARKLLKSGRAVIYKYRPIFTIRILDREDGDTQDIEYSCDTGYQHIGISIKSEKHEYLNEQRNLLKDEVERHNDCQKYRRTRRNRLRYRKPRFNNREGMICKDGFAPSLRNKRDIHIDLLKSYTKIIPVTRIVMEMGNFDTQLLKALEEDRPVPKGTDYQRGERYGIETLREAVFTRDHHTCRICKKKGGILRIHHVGYYRKDRTNRLSNLLTVCDKCHTSKNHQPGGKLYGLKPVIKKLAGATFMTSVRWDMLRRIKEVLPDADVRVTYGAMTKIKRKELGLKKTHANDAYAMGELHPKHRTDFREFDKVRRNRRILEMFYDAKYEDIRDGSIKKGAAIGSNRTNRSVPRNNPDNERKFRGRKISKGRRTIRKRRYPINPKDLVEYEGEIFIVKGVQNNGTYVALDGITPKAIGKIRLIRYAGGWHEKRKI